MKTTVANRTFIGTRFTNAAFSLEDDGSDHFALLPRASA